MKGARSQTGRPRLPKVDPEMRRWCALLEEEVATWPGVTSRPMFGLGGYYRDGQIFAAIPRSRAVETPFSLLLKLPRTRDRRLTSGRAPGASWVTFALESEADLGEALRYLGRAFEQAKETKPRARKKPRSSPRVRR
jgi:hypothetical protein